MHQYRRAISLSLFAMLAGAGLAPMQALAQAVPAKPRAQAVKRYTIEQFMATTSLTGASFSKDEKQILFSSNESGIFNAYTVPVSGGKPRALTASKTDTTYAVGYFYNDDRILFTRDGGGDEQNHLYVRELDGKERDLTPGDKLKASFAGWKSDGSGFYVVTNERDPKFFDLYLYDAATYARTVVYKNDSGMNVSAISRDGNWLAFNKPATTSDSDVYVYNVQAREMKHITPHKEPASHAAADFDPASKRLLFTSNAMHRASSRASSPMTWPAATSTKSKRPTGTCWALTIRATAATASAWSTATAASKCACMTKQATRLLCPSCRAARCAR